MIVDFHHSEYMAFNGSSYSKLPNNDTKYILGQNIKDNSLSIQTFYGIIHFSSKYTEKTNKMGVIRKDCTPFIKHLPRVLAKTKRIDQKKDMYALLRIEEIVDGVVYCDVLKYIEENEKEIFEEDKFLETVCTAHWTRTKKMLTNFQEHKNIDLTPNRRKIIDAEIYSIDPEGCVDIDDALHCIPILNSEQNIVGYEIGIHIADVSSFISENSLIDDELQQRVETIYLPKGASPIHMIPEELSINNISLLENNFKRAFSIIINLNDKYETERISYEKTMIKVTKNLTYEMAQKMIDNKNNDSLCYLYTIAEKLKSKINFNSDEIYDTHQMVAIYMILANKFVGEKIQSFDHNNVLLRVHQIKKDPILLNNDNNNNNNNNDLALIKKYNSNLMEQAKYQIGIENCKHYGLNLPYYTHFTSPIRRYADINVHRHLWKVINNEKIERLNTKTIFLMNFYGKFYKQIERYNELIILAKIFGNDYDITDAYITYFDDTESMKLYIPKYNLDFNYQICNYRMKHIFTISLENPHTMIIKNNHTLSEKKFLLFQKIQIKMIVSQKNIINVIVQIMDNEKNEQTDDFFLCI